MPQIPKEILDWGAITVIFIFFIKEFFVYLKTKKNEKDGVNSELSDLILRELQTMNNNHLHSIQDAIEKGNSNLVNVIHADNVQMIEALGEIKGRLK